MAYSKYHAKKTTVDSITFDSKKEAEYYKKLKALEQAGKIRDLELQKEYVLIPKQTGKDGKCKERKCSYFADFCYNDDNGTFHVIDTKGMKTADYKIKRKLMLWVHGIEIEEV